MDGNVSYGPSGDTDTKAKPKKPKDDKSFIADIREKLQAGYDADKENRKEASVDLSYLAGDQWPEQIKTERQAAGRPMLTLNRLPQFVNQVTNDIRQADFSIKVSPVDDESDPELAKLYNGLLKQIQYQSAANQVYAKGAEHQVACGIGWWRVCSEYVDDEAFDQELRLKSIRNPLSVYCDPAAVEEDRSDANWMIVTEMIPKAAFEDRYPDKSVSDVDAPGDSFGNGIHWVSTDTVRIAEYWCRKPVEKTLIMLPDGKAVFQEDVDPATVPPPVPGSPPPKTRKVTTYEVEQYIVSGTEILEGPTPWPGKWIPLVPAIGNEIPLEKTIVRSGMIRNARDAQALYNYNRTASAEALALQPKNPWVVTWNMIKQYTGFWNKANTANVPYLVYDVDNGAPGGKPYREPPPALSPAFANEAMIADQDMKATTGIYDASLGNQSNETSGIAIGRREKQGDTANFHYSDKLQLALWHTGRILVDVIPKFYDAERCVRIMGEDDSEETAWINQNTMVTMEDGVQRNTVLNDLSSARFDVRVKIGPSYSTKREEAAQFVTEFMRVDPTAAPLVRDILAKNSDMSGAEDMAKRFKNVLEGKHPLAPPEDANAPPQPPPPPPPDPALVKVEQEGQLAQQKMLQETELSQAKLQADAQLQQQQISAEMQKAELMAQVQLQLGREKMAMEIELQREKMRADIELQREKQNNDAEVARFNATHKAAAAHEAAQNKPANGSADH